MKIPKETILLTVLLCRSAYSFNEFTHPELLVTPTQYVHVPAQEGSKITLLTRVSLKVTFWLLKRESKEAKLQLTHMALERIGSNPGMVQYVTEAIKQDPEAQARITRIVIDRLTFKKASELTSLLLKNFWSTRALPALQKHQNLIFALIAGGLILGSYALVQRYWPEKEKIASE